MSALCECSFYYLLRVISITVATYENTFNIHTWVIFAKIESVKCILHFGTGAKW